MSRRRPARSRPVVWCSAEPSSCIAPSSPRTPTTTSTPRASTIVEWPSAKKKPTLSGRCPSSMSLRVVLSIAADVVGVERVAHAEHIGGDPDAGGDRAADERKEADGMQEEDDPAQAGGPPPLRARHRTAWTRSAHRGQSPTIGKCEKRASNPVASAIAARTSSSTSAPTTSKAPQRSHAT